MHRRDAPELLHPEEQVGVRDGHRRGHHQKRQKTSPPPPGAWHRAKSLRRQRRVFKTRSDPARVLKTRFVVFKRRVFDRRRRGGDRQDLLRREPRREILPRHFCRLARPLVAAPPSPPSAAASGEKSNPSVVAALIAKSTGYATNGARFAASVGRYVNAAPMSGPKINPREMAPHRRISPVARAERGVSFRAAARRAHRPCRRVRQRHGRRARPLEHEHVSEDGRERLGHEKAERRVAAWLTVFQKKMALCLPVTSATHPHAGVATKPTRGRNALTYPISVGSSPSARRTAAGTGSCTRRRRRRRSTTPWRSAGGGRQRRTPQAASKKPISSQTARHSRRSPGPSLPRSARGLGRSRRFDRSRTPHRGAAALRAPRRAHTTRFLVSTHTANVPRRRVPEILLLLQYEPPRGS